MSALVHLNGNYIKIRWLPEYAKKLTAVGFQTEYGLIFLKNSIELNQCPDVRKNSKNLASFICQFTLCCKKCEPLFTFYGRDRLSM